MIERGGANTWLTPKVSVPFVTSRLYNEMSEKEAKRIESFSSAHVVNQSQFKVQKSHFTAEISTTFLPQLR